MKPTHQYQALALSTLAFTVCFAVWTIFSIIGVQIRQDLGLSNTQFGLLVGTPILTGSLVRLIMGIWAEQYGGRRVFTLLMILSAVSTWLLASATTYEMMLLAALALGFAGGSFIVGIVYVAHWFSKEKQGMAMGVLGMGNAGAAVTKFIAPYVMVAFGWQAVAQVWAVGLLAVAVLFWLFTKEDPTLAARRRKGGKAASIFFHLQPLRNIQVWRFSLYYVFVFGAFVALALWLPMYYVNVYGVDIKVAGFLAAFYSLAGSVFRATGGWLSDRYGPRRVMYWTFGASLICLFLLSYPSTEYTVHGIEGDIHFSLATGIVPFTLIIFVLGFFMSFGKAAVYKHITNYYPEHVGSVGGIVGLIGGLGGFFLPILFGLANDYIGIWTSCFMLLFGLAALSLTLMHTAVRRLELTTHPRLKEQTDLPEFVQAKKRVS